MTPNLRKSAIFAILTLVAVSTFGQTDPQTGTYQTLIGTVIDIDNGRSRLQLEIDAEKSRQTVEADSVSTTYHDFGGLIAGKPEIFRGSSGFSNIRLGDRVRVTGSNRGTGIVAATVITLLGREVIAGTTGVGQTRNPTSASAQVQVPTGGLATETGGGSVEGTIRTLNLTDNRIVIQTPQRRMMTVRTYRNTPVIYRGQTYRLTNLEVGDEIRVEANPRDAQADDITARRIEVIRSVQDSDTTPSTGGVVTILDGAVSRVEPGLDYAYVKDDRNDVRVDMSQAEDAQGNPIHARDLRVGDNVEMSGSFNRVGDLFLASTVRFVAGTSTSVDSRDDISRYAVVTITGTITETLEDASTLAVRDRESNRTLRVWVTDDFLVRNKAGSTTPAENLRVNDTVVLKAFRDAAGNLIAQTIRLRNR